MSTSTGLGKLKQAGKDLRMQWEETRTVWHDVNSRQFEDRFIAPLLNRLHKMEMMLAHMGAVLQKVHRDCE